jgi:hypothetical protein
MTNDPSSTPFDGLSFLLGPETVKTKEQEVEASLPSLSNFENWLTTASPGDQLVYAKNIFWLDARKSADMKQHILPLERREICKAAYRAYLEGKAELCQRKIGKVFEYLIQKRKEIKPNYSQMTMCGRTDLI